MIGDFIFNNERLFLVTLFLSKTRSFCYSFLRNSHTDTEEKDSRTFLGREGALSLFDLLSYKNTKREERVLTEFPSLISSLSLLSNTLVLLLLLAAERVYSITWCKNHGDGISKCASRVVLSLVGVLEFFFLFVFSKEKSFDCDEAFFIPFGKKRNRLVFVVFIIVVFVSRKYEQKSSSS